MKRIKLYVWGIAASIIIWSGQVWSTAPAEREADLILHNGEIYTPGGWAQALAVKDGVIISVGAEEAVNRNKTAKTRVIDLHGATVIPGLHDMHVHPMGSGLQQLQ